MAATPTSAVAAPLAMIFVFNDDVVLRALDGLTDEELKHAPSGRNNAMFWVAGHVVQTRAMVLQLLGESVDTGWGHLFDRGATVAGTNHYPSREDLVRTMRDVSARLHARLASLDDETLARSASMQLPHTRTVADELAFFALHDSYHAGQMGYIRKALGYPGLVG